MNYKLHYGVRAVRCLRSILDHPVLSYADALRNLQRQLTNDRNELFKKTATMINYTDNERN